MGNQQGNIGYIFTKLFFSRKPIMGTGTGTFPNMAYYGNRLRTSISIDNCEIPAPIGSHTCDLITTYPGLIIGSGYPHDVQDEEGLKLGFFFDHATGLPVIPGSSIKGILKSVFDKVDGDYIIHLLQEMSDPEGGRTLHSSDHREAIAALAPDLAKVKQWALEMFGSNDEEKNTPPSQRDVFFDAFPVESKNNKGLLLGNDYITPHIPNPLKNPNPIQFLKVLPQVKFRFDFQLLDSSNGLTAILKLELFRQLLLDFGAGAKTNVGYGQFSTAYMVETNKNTAKPENGGTGRNILFKEVLTAQHLEELTYDAYTPANNIRKALVVDENDKEYRLRLLDDCYLVKTKKSILKTFEKAANRRKSKGKPHEFQILETGMEITIVIKRPNEMGKVTFGISPIWKT